jgi:diaminopimelate epimerase
MLLEFTKMNGAGNDFIVIDNRSGKIKLSPEQVAFLCHRHHGIGADGLMLLKPCSSKKADWAWDFFNSDGSTAEMCGNGARCFARYVQKLTGKSDDFTFETVAGINSCSFEGGEVTISLMKPKDLRLDQKVTLSTGTQAVHSFTVGNPHAVVFVDDADKAMVQELGREIRRHPHFAPGGINVNFVQKLGPGSIRVRTYERGVEGETLACGTGASAAAMITAKLHQLSSPVKVQVQNGDTLKISFKQINGEFTDVKLTGPAKIVFEGKIEI